MIEAVLAFDAPTAEMAAKLVVGGFGDELGAGDVLLSGRSVDAERLFREVRSRGHFDIECRGRKTTFGGVRNFNHALLMFENYLVPAALDLLGKLNQEGFLILARIYDDQYEHWQNAKDPLLFQVAGRSMDGLPMKSNGLPPPLNKVIVDTSANPGRRVLRDGYVEAVGHKMWLGPEFFRRVPGASREAVLASQWLNVTERPDGIFELVAHEEPFVDDTTADMQNRLRRLLFPTTADEV